MKRVLLCLAVLALSACSGSGTCTNTPRTACDLDAGSGCAEHETCVDALFAIDPCPEGAAGCCFQVCTQDADCTEGELCTAGACAVGRCVADAGP